MRFLRIALVAVLAWLGFRWLEPRGLGGVGLGVAGAVAIAWIFWRAMRIRRQRARDARADQWAEALMSPPERPAAIAQLREELAALDPKKDAAQHARLTLVLAELLEADGAPADALAALARVSPAELSDTLGAVVCHARAVSHLSAGDPAKAADALDGIGGPTGDRAIDTRVRLMRGLIAAERGDGEEAQEVAELCREEAGGDADVALEARVLKAVALDALGDRADARKVMHAISEDMLEVLRVLGLPRVRGLAAEVLQERAEADADADEAAEARADAGAASDAPARAEAGPEADAEAGSDADAEAGPDAAEGADANAPGPRAGSEA
jgi:hypothetical protein